MPERGVSELSDADCDRILTLYEEYYTYEQTSKRFRVTPSGAYKVVQQYNEHHTYHFLLRSGCLCNPITPQMQRHVLRTTRYYRFATYQEIADIIGDITKQEVQRLAHGVGYRRCVAITKPFLKSHIIQKRIKWAEDNKERDWDSNMWTNECSISTAKLPAVPSMMMSTSVFPRPLLDITAIGDTSPHGGHHHLSDPIPDFWYPSSFVKDAGWLYSPMYFIDQGNDGLHHVFCWSLSEYKGSGLNFIWRVRWSLHSEPTLALYQRFQEHESYPVKLNGYVFDASSPDSRAMWRETMMPTIFSPSIAGVALYPSIQLDWFGSSSLGSTMSLPPQPWIPVPSYRTHQSTNNLVQGLSGSYVNPVDTSLSPDPDPSSQSSDTSSDIFFDAPEDFEAEKVEGSNAYFCKDTRGNITLNVSRTLENRDAVESFLEQALPQLDKSVRRIKCSLCKDKKADREWGVKPSNLRRHILAHLGIKGMLSPNECCVFVLMLQ
ncbi:hypothetical protein RSOLAG22IIIB_12207 [Rhizoctonia solani]|uniref:Uncharacterized protein n=1 Tax=Rhizoctonia solani TaxID=456999 RepID=A0A0K6GCW1_9AGAM|nr:hypothetical protein RSOLAG22IIIB_12207 [Rhizoctonia solani]